MKKLLLLLMVSHGLTYAQVCPVDSVLHGGQYYHTYAVGSQCWLRENLDIGIMIDSSIEQSNNGIIEKYCYSNDPLNCQLYGGLYQWNEAMQYIKVNGAQGVCPSGWHLASDQDYYQLENFLDPAINNPNSLGWRGVDAGTRLKAGGASGLEFVLAGERYGIIFYGMGFSGYYWTSTESTNLSGGCTPNYPYCYAWHRRLDQGPQIGRYDNTGYTYDPKSVGMSLRCVLGQGAVTALSNPVNAFRFDVYPNPFTDHVEISGVQEDIVIEMTDIHGRLVTATTRKEGASLYLALPPLVPGVYFIKVSGVSGTRVKQLIKTQSGIDQH